MYAMARSAAANQIMFGSRRRRTAAATLKTKSLLTISVYHVASALAAFLITLP